MNLAGWLRSARTNIGVDNKLAAFMVRELPETEAADLRDLAWSMSDFNTGYIADNEAEYLLDEIAKRSAKSVGLVEALVVNFDTIGLTKICVETLREFYPDLRLILVDNGSTDGSREWIERLAEDELCRCVLLKENTTHGPGLHRGMEIAIGDFVLILDSDTETLKSGFIEPMVQLFLSAPNVFAVGTLDTGDITGTRPGTYPIIHPARIMLSRKRYFLGRAFCHAGQPIHLAMRDVRERKDLLLHFPLNEYIKHYGGGTRAVVGRRIQESRGRR